MPSSISSSELQGGDRDARRAAFLLLSCAVAFLLALEVWVRYRGVELSRMENRIEDEYRAVLGLRREQSTHHVLVLCNSLLGVGLDFGRFRAELLPEWDARRLYVDDTDFHDWYYATRHLLAQGVEVDAIALALSARQIASKPEVRGDYFAYRLMDPVDVVRVARDVGASPTEASSMLVASMSAFYGLRGEFRKVLLGNLMPGLPRLMQRIARFDDRPLEEDVTYRRALERLTAFRELLDDHGVRFLVVLPPIPYPEGLEAVERAGADAGVTFVSVPSDLAGPSDYSDGFHLNADGARKYTPVLAEALGRTLGSPVRVAKAE